ncbi:MAG: valine--tRNA ligase [Candidatus Moranbacteria bacterium]|nr:valine--tRNA ligase [Candidatus Moranbacteria bacterium]
MKELSKAYNPQEHEDTVYQQWESSGFFNPDTCIDKGVTQPDAPYFSLVLPPPNVTGTLHLGHASMLAVEDIMVRYHRMRGYRTLWIPGTDHAALATQEKVERLLWHDEKKTRHDLGRDAFLKRVEQFAQNSHDTIVNQCKKMGASLDWSREAYTLDNKRHEAVYTAFKKMFSDGIIYRGARIVNWDPRFQTTVSDDELERKEERASFYYLKYGPFEIGTARPETKFGDKYIVMHPDDERYADYTHGQVIENIEWINGVISAMVIKDEVVDMNFGTGVMTITPWHDATDFDIAQRHNLDKEQVIDYDGKLLPIAGEFSGMNISDARDKIVAKLRSKGLVARVDENYVHNIAVNSRGEGVIEPQIKEQWFVDVNKEFERNGTKTTLKTLMQNAVRSGDVSVIPSRFEKIYFHWIDNLRDWCISRQIWFGHRVPVWYRNGEVYCDVHPPENDGWVQDPDTLDTWFSSGLWTFSTLGWPSDTPDLQTYHPTSVLETGYDILFFWVARMILMSMYLLDEIPFRATYLHGLVRDEQGRKMSKSLGNVINPLDMNALYGTDAVRLSLVIGSTPGSDLRLGEEKIASFRNFTNKLWNIGRYVMHAVDSETFSQKISVDEIGSVTDDLSDADRWILHKLSRTVSDVSLHIDAFRFSQAGEVLRDFTWNTFADWYVEVHKIEKNDYVLTFVFQTLLRLWHPFMPFVTETLWQSLLGTEHMLMTEQYPNAKKFHSSFGSFETFSFENTVALVSAIRNIRSTYRIAPSELLTVTIATNPNTVIHNDIICRLGRIASVERIGLNDSAPENSASFLSGDLKMHVHLSGVVDFDAERSRLDKEIASVEKYISGLSSRLSGPFAQKAPAHVVAKERESLSDAQSRLSQLVSEHDSLPV